MKMKINFPKSFILYTKEDVLEMYRLRFIEHKTLQEIGNEYHLSRERIRQLLGNSGYISQMKQEDNNDI